MHEHAVHVLGSFPLTLLSAANHMHAAQAAAEV
jgi:hypothetical protein